MKLKKSKRVLQKYKTLIYHYKFVAKWYISLNNWYENTFDFRRISSFHNEWLGGYQMIIQVILIGKKLYNMQITYQTHIWNSANQWTQTFQTTCKIIEKNTAEDRAETFNQLLVSIKFNREKFLHCRLNYSLLWKNAAPNPAGSR